MESVKIVAQNKKAYHDYFIDETYEAGVVLVGSEVKSVRGGKVSFADSFVSIKDGEAVLENFYIAPYEKGSFYNPESRRDRVLLLNRREIDRLRAAVERKVTRSSRPRSILSIPSSSSSSGLREANTITISATL